MVKIVVEVKRLLSNWSASHFHRHEQDGEHDVVGVEHPRDGVHARVELLRHRGIEMFTIVTSISAMKRPTIVTAKIAHLRA